MCLYTYIYIYIYIYIYFFCPDALTKYLQPQQEPVEAVTEETSVSLPSSQETLSDSVSEQECKFIHLRILTAVLVLHIIYIVL